MQPIKIVFQSIFTANDQDFNRYKGIKQINKIIEREWDDLKKGSYLTNAFKNIVNLYISDIEALFFEDFSSSSFKTESATFELKKVGHGHAPPEPSGHDFNYEVEVVITSKVYTCLNIFENGTFVCYDESDKELKFIRHTGQTMVV